MCTNQPDLISFFQTKYYLKTFAIVINIIIPYFPNGHWLCWFIIQFFPPFFFWHVSRSCPHLHIFSLFQNNMRTELPEAKPNVHSVNKRDLGIPEILISSHNPEGEIQGGVGCLWDLISTTALEMGYGPIKCEVMRVSRNSASGQLILTTQLSILNYTLLARIAAGWDAVKGRWILTAAPFGATRKPEKVSNLISKPVVNYSRQHLNTMLQSAHLIQISFLPLQNRFCLSILLGKIADLRR